MQLEVQGAGDTGNLDGDHNVNTRYGDPVYGLQFQDQAVAGKKNEGYVLVEYEPVTIEILDLVSFYSVNLAVPASRSTDAEEFRLGREIFNNIGCASCHRPSYKTPDSFETGNEFRNQMIWPYSDMLLHDMGEGLADSGAEGLIQRREWRTQPLWGIGLAKSVHPDIGFLHDGRAKTIQEAILWHDGEAGASREKYQKLSPADRHSIISFLNSI